jgi:hypothetical protein
MRLFLATGALLLVTLLTGCNDSAQAPTAATPATPATASSSPPSSPADSPSPSPTAATESTLISGKGIGAAQLGITLGALKQALGTEATFTVKSPFIVDFDAIAVQKDGKVQYYILYLADQSFSDQDVIQGLFTDNPKFRTAEGIGAGSTLQAAEQAYGNATLAYNTDNEAREYARFDRQPAPNLSFGTGTGNVQSAGIYPAAAGGYNETQEFKPDATIKSVLLVCLAEECAPSDSP